MRRLRPKPLRAAALAAAVALGILLASAGCSYLKWKHEKQVARAQRRAHPTLVLDKEIAPEDCFVVTGRGVAPPDGRLDPFLVAAYDRGGTHELVGSHEVVYPDGTYGILLPTATHVGVLSDPAALEALSRMFDATMGSSGAGASRP